MLYPSRKIIVGLLFFVFAVGGGAGLQPAYGDLGALVARGEMGQQRITVLAAPSPLRVGRVLLSLSLQPTQEAPDSPMAGIDLTFSPPGEAHHGGQHQHGELLVAQATSRGSTHPGMLEARVDLQTAGVWNVEARFRNTGQDESFSFDLEVGPPASPWFDYGLAFAFPLVGILVFIWHQRRSLSGMRKDTGSI